MLKAYRYLFYRIYRLFKKPDDHPEIFALCIMLILFVMNIFSNDSTIFFISGYSIIPILKITFGIRVLLDVVGGVFLAFYTLRVLNLKKIIKEFDSETGKQKIADNICVISYITISFIFLGVSLYLYNITATTGFTLFGYLKPIFLRIFN